MKNAATKIKDNLPALMQSLRRLEHKEVLVGVPSGAGSPEGSSANYASIAFWQDNGAPEANIPARPFMRPGIKSVQKDVALKFKLAAKDGLDGKSNVEKYLMQAGLIASSGIKNYINEGIDPPLADSTLLARARGAAGIGIRKGAQAELIHRDTINPDTGEAYAPGSTGITPLVITGGLRNSITYIIKTNK